MSRGVKKGSKQLTLLVVGGALAAGVLVAGCGDDDVAAALSKSEWIAKADAICRQQEKQSNAAGEAYAAQNKITGKPTAAQFKPFVQQVLIPSGQGQIDDLRALEVPAGDETEIAAFLDSAQSELDRLKADPASGFGEGRAGESPFAGTEALGKAYGLKDCAR